MLTLFLVLVALLASLGIVGIVMFLFMWFSPDEQTHDEESGGSGKAFQ